MRKYVWWADDSTFGVTNIQACNLSIIDHYNSSSLKHQKQQIQSLNVHENRLHQIIKPSQILLFYCNVLQFFVKILIR